MQSKQPVFFSDACPRQLLAASWPHLLFSYRRIHYSISKLLGVPLRRSGAEVYLIELARLQSAERVPRVSTPAFAVVQRFYDPL